MEFFSTDVVFRGFLELIHFSIKPSRTLFIYFCNFWFLVCRWKADTSNLFENLPFEIMFFLKRKTGKAKKKKVLLFLYGREIFLISRI